MSGERICEQFAAAPKSAPRGCPAHWGTPHVLRIDAAIATVLELSPRDGSGFATAQAYPWAAGEVPCSEEDFQSCLLEALRLHNGAVMRAMEERSRRWHSGM